MTQSVRRKRAVGNEVRALAGLWRPRLSFYAGLAQSLPDFAFVAVRTRLYRMAGIGLGNRSTVLGRIKLVGMGPIAGRFRTGTGCLIAPSVTLGLDADITLGDAVSLSPGVCIYTATHGLGFGSRRMDPAPAAKPVSIGDGVWVGMNALILPGVTLGQGCVVSAGAVVAKDVEPNVLVAGNPAAVVQKLPFGDR